MQGRKDRTLTTLDTLSMNLIEEGYSVTTASSFRWKPLRLLHMLWRVFWQGKKNSVVLIDTYSSQNFWYAVATAWLSRMKGLRYIPILHGGNLPERLKKSPYQSKQLFGKAYRNVAPSPYLFDVFQGAGYTNVVQVSNSLELNNYPFKERIHLQPNLLWVRSFAEIYNPEMALQVLEFLLPKYPKANLCMIGPDKDGSLERCKRIAKEKGLPVRFTGKLSKAAWRTMATEYDIFINTTNFDNTPVSVMEAMALGMPVVSTEVGGIPHLLSNRDDALLVSAQDPMAMHDAIVDLLEDSTLAHRLSITGRKKVEAFDWENVKTKWMDLLDA